MIDSSWFTTDFDYSGPAEVIFESPYAEFFGQASVGPDEYGRPLVEMVIERSSPAIQNGFDIFAIEHGSHDLPGQTVIQFGDGARNKASITVRAKDGVFTTKPSWEYAFSTPSPDKPLTLRLSPTKSEYTAVSLANENFLVLPLTGFVSEWPRHSPIISSHPLRLQQGGITSAAGCIPFQVGRQQAFIQRLSDVEGGKEGIKPWASETVLTAVAVVPFVESAMLDPWGWFLNVFLRLLDFASGGEVGVPWIEVRDENHRLARRLHFAINPLSYSAGYAALPREFHWQNGEFLTAALSSPEAREPFFSIALRHCCKAGQEGLSLDDQFSHLVRALECLCKYYGFSRQDLVEGLVPKMKNAVNVVLDQAGAEIQNLTNTITDANRSHISKIAARVRSAAQIDRSFGLAIESLVKHFGLLDSEILEAYYATQPESSGRSWSQSLSYYRGAVFHEGYIDLDSPDTPVGELFGFILHLHDLLVRILLKIIGYRGLYQPRLIRGTGAETADWFQPGVRVDGLLNVPTMGL